MDQLSFRDIEIQELQARVQAIGGDYQERLKAVARMMGREKFSLLNDISPSYGREILNGNGAGKPFQPGMVGSLLVGAPDLYASDVLGWECRLINHTTPEPEPDMTPEEELKDLKRKIRDHGLEPILLERRRR